MQLTLNQPVVLVNPGTASGLKTWLQVASDFGDAEVRVAYYDTGWHLLGDVTADSPTEKRVVVYGAQGDAPIRLLEVTDRKVSVTLTKVSQPGTVVCVELNQTLIGS